MTQDCDHKIKLLLLWNILCRYTDEEHPMNTDEIIEKLAEKGIVDSREVHAACMCSKTNVANFVCSINNYNCLIFESLALRRMLVLNKSASLRSAETSIRLGKYAERIDFLNINKIEIGETLKLQPCVMGVRAKPLAKSPICHNGKRSFLRCFTLKFVVIFSIIFGIKIFLRRFRYITGKRKFFFKNTVDNPHSIIYNATTIEYRGEINSDS